MKKPRWWGLAAGVGLALVAGGCSLSFPIPSFFGPEDDLVTGSLPESAVAPPAVTRPVLPDLTSEDWRRARAALAVAIDPQGNGAEVSWDNPETGRKGRFAPSGEVYLQADRICRAFRAKIEEPGGVRLLDGTACRLSGGEWTLRELEKVPGAS